MAPDPVESSLPDDSAAFAAPTPPTAPIPLSRKCEGCETPHAGTYGSGRFCSATCAKKVGARHKWAARAATGGGGRRASGARRAVADARCESCGKLHDRSYGSGRFCSVHCARRVAATRKWEKSRTEKNKRLEAIRPAMLEMEGKRRRVVDGQLGELRISESVPFYVGGYYGYGGLGGYLPPAVGPVHYQHVGVRQVQSVTGLGEGYYGGGGVYQVGYEEEGEGESAARALLCLRATNS